MNIANVRNIKMLGYLCVWRQITGHVKKLLKVDFVQFKALLHKREHDSKRNINLVVSEVTT